MYVCLYLDIYIQQKRTTIKQLAIIIPRDRLRKHISKYWHKKQEDSGMDIYQNHESNKIFTKNFFSHFTFNIERKKIMKIFISNINIYIFSASSHNKFNYKICTINHEKK